MLTSQLNVLAALVTFATGSLATPLLSLSVDFTEKPTKDLVYFDAADIPIVTDSRADSLGGGGCVLVAIFGNFEERIRAARTHNPWQFGLKEDIYWQGHGGIAPWCADDHISTFPSGSAVTANLDGKAVYDSFSDRWGQNNTVYLILKNLDKEEAGESSKIKALDCAFLMSPDLAPRVCVYSAELGMDKFQERIRFWFIERAREMTNPYTVPRGDSLFAQKPYRAAIGINTETVADIYDPWGEDTAHQR